MSLTRVGREVAVWEWCPPWVCLGVGVVTIVGWFLGFWFRLVRVVGVPTFFGG